jgi:membrane protein
MGLRPADARGNGGALRGWLRGLARFVAELARAQYRDQLILRAAALAYTTLLSIVPVMTVALVMVARVQPERAAKVVAAIAAVFPFSPAHVQATLAAFAERTAALGWVAVVISVLITFNAFWQVEEVINAIWGLPRRRRWEVRLVSFATVVVTGPLLLAALFSGLYWLSSRFWYPLVAPLLRPLPALLAAVALTAFYRWVPHTRVPWRAAVTGAGVGALALTVLHLSFQTYFGLAGNLNNVVYGSLAMLLFFLVSLFLLWFAILLGAEASWVVGNVAPAPRTEGVRRLLELLAAIYSSGTLSTDAVVRLLGHTGDDVLARLAAAPPILLGAASGWRLARPPEAITVEDVRERTGADAAGESDSPAVLTLAGFIKQASGEWPALDGAAGTAPPAREG